MSGKARVSREPATVPNFRSVRPSAVARPLAPEVAAAAEPADEVAADPEAADAAEEPEPKRSHVRPRKRDLPAATVDEVVADLTKDPRRE
jgi:hypothetical protein